MSRGHGRVQRAVLSWLDDRETRREGEWWWLRDFPRKHAPRGWAYRDGRQPLTRAELESLRRAVKALGRQGILEWHHSETELGELVFRRAPAARLTIPLPPRPSTHSLSDEALPPTLSGSDPQHINTGHRLSDEGEQRHGAFAELHQVDDAGTLRRFGDMNQADLEYLASRYEQQCSHPRARVIKGLCMACGRRPEAAR